jgi:hypothetical protein
VLEQGWPTDGGQRALAVNCKCSTVSCLALCRRLPEQRRGFFQPTFVTRPIKKTPASTQVGALHLREGGMAARLAGGLRPQSRPRAAQGEARRPRRRQGSQGRPRRVAVDARSHHRHLGAGRGRDRLPAEPGHGHLAGAEGQPEGALRHGRPDRQHGLDPAQSPAAAPSTPRGQSQGAACAAARGRPDGDPAGDRRGA